MANLSKERRDRMIAKLEELKKSHSDDASIAALNEIENALREKKYGLVWEEHSEAVDEMLRENIPVLVADPERRLCKDETLPWNFIIEGDNLQALHLLEKTHHGKVDCIYIDPPYNTGARDWKYNNDYVDGNDEYRHSKWISMMEKRLSIARRLLAKDGVLIITIDDNELANLLLLVKTVFPEYQNTIITIQMNPGGTQSDGFSVTNEYAIVTYLKEYTKISRKAHIGDDPYNLRRWGSTSNRYAGATCFYPVIIDEDGNISGFGDVLPDDIHPSAQVEQLNDGSLLVWPIDKNNIEKKWRYARDTVETVVDRMFYERDGERIEIKLNRETEPFKTVWTSDEYNAESHGTKLIKSIIGKDRFSYPKSLYATKDCLQFAIADKPNATVLDFFAGSGTTMHAVNLINAEDGGNRRCIVVTNNEISEEDEKNFAIEQFGNENAVIWDKHPEEKGAKFSINYNSVEFVKYKDLHGIAKYVTWPRINNSILGINEDHEQLKGEYLTNIVQKKELTRKFIHIDFVENPMEMSKAKKKKIVATLCGKTLPQSEVYDDCKYVFSENSKYTSTILFDDTAIDEWVSKIVVNDNIDTFYIITSKPTVFRKAKEKVLSVFEPLFENEHVTIPMANGFMSNVKYFKCDWTPRKPEDYLLSNALCLHIKELIELQTAQEVDGVKNVIILSKSDYNRVLENPETAALVENVWVNENLCFNAAEMRVLRSKKFRYIPREYFCQELKEVGEYV